MATHYLKTWPTQFEQIKERRKTFEYRKNDRNFEEGDLLILQNWDPTLQEDLETPIGYSGEEILVKCGAILKEGFGLPKGYCVISIYNPVYYKTDSKATYVASLIDNKTEQQ